MNPIKPVSQAPSADAKKSPRSPEGDAAHVADDGVLTVESSRILSGRQEVAIRHNGRTYRLRCTRSRESPAKYDR